MMEVAMNNTESMLLRNIANAICTDTTTMSRSSMEVHDFESLGWEDLPIMIQKTEHPSFSIEYSRRRQLQQENQPPPEEPIFFLQPAINFGAPGAYQSSNTNNPMELSWAKPQSFTTFGWGDFPIAAGADAASDRPTMQETPLQVVRAREESNTMTISTKKPVSYHTNMPSASTEDPKKRHIQFSQVYIRQHSIRLGDHPLCFSYPVSLGWAHGEDRILTIDEYEEQRQQGGASRMDVLERRSRLAESMGLTLGQIDALERERIQRTRGSLELHRTNSSLASLQPNVEDYLEMSMHIGYAIHPGLDSQLIVR